MAWMQCQNAWVLPEALEYFEAVLPGSALVLRPVLGASLRDAAE
jgi:hypothetical protein